MNHPLSNITNTSRLSMGPPRKNATTAQPQSNVRQSSVGMPRPSLGPRATANNRTSSIGSRASTIGTRQSSIGGRRSHDGRKSMGGPMKDTRNVTDREFQRNAVRNIIQFLLEAGYTKPISPKVVSAPSTKDFLSIVEFLFQLFEMSSYKIGTKPEEFTNDVIHVFNTIGYPFPLMKSNISTVGAPHAWPAFLAALDWFVALLKGGLEPSEPDGFEEGSFFSYLCKSYSGFLSGGDDFQSFEEEIAINFANKDNATIAEINNMQSVRSEVIAEIGIFESSPDRIGELETKKKHLSLDIQKFNNLIEKLDAHNSQLKKKGEEGEKECQQREKEYSSARDEKAQLEGRVAQQEEQSVDAAKINKEKNLLEESLNSAIKTKEQANQKLWDQEMTNHKKMEDITKSLALYEKLANNLLLLGPNTKNANGVDYKINFNGVNSETQVRSILKDIVKPGLLKLKEELVSKIISAMDELTSLDVRVRALAEEASDKKQQIASEETKHTKLEAIFQKEKEKWMAEVKQVEVEIELASKQIDRLKSEAANELGRSHKSVETLTLEREEMSKQLEQRTKEMNEYAIRLVDVLAKHKEFIHKRLQDVVSHHRNVLVHL